jgi:hypothetical protein
MHQGRANPALDLLFPVTSARHVTKEELDWLDAIIFDAIACISMRWQPKSINYYGILIAGAAIGSRSRQGERCSDLGKERPP